MKILFDADDTAEQLLPAWLETLSWKYGTSVTEEDVHSWDLRKAFPYLSDEQIFGVLKEESLWDKLKPMPGAQEVLQKLHNEGHELFMVTASHYDTLSMKMPRIMAMFPWLDWEHVIITARKQMIDGDVLIDDNPDNLIGFKNYKFLFSRPHNRDFNVDEHGIIKVNDWYKIYECIWLLNCVKSNILFTWRNVGKVRAIPKDTSSYRVGDTITVCADTYIFNGLKFVKLNDYLLAVL